MTSVSILLESSRASAIDPYAAAGAAVSVATNVASGPAGMAAGFASGLLGGGGGKGDLEDLSSLGFEFTDLLDDFDIDDSAGESLRAKVRELEDVQSKLKEGGDQVQDMSESIDEVKRAEGLKSTLQAIHQMVQRTKSIAQMIPGHPKASQSALQVQETRLNYMMLDELTALRQIELEKKIDSNTRESRFRLLARDIQKEETKNRR